MKTYINPQTQLVALQSEQINCQFVQIVSAGGDFNLGTPLSSEEQM